MNISKVKFIYSLLLVMLVMASCQKQTEVTPQNTLTAGANITTKQAVVKEFIGLINSSEAAKVEVLEQLKTTPSGVALTTVLTKLKAVGINNEATEKLNNLATKVAKEQQSEYGTSFVELTLTGKSLLDNQMPLQVVTYQERENTINAYNLKQEVTQLSSETALTTPAIAVDYRMAADNVTGENLRRIGGRTYVTHAFCKNDYESGAPEMYVTTTFFNGQSAKLKQQVRKLPFWRGQNKIFSAPHDQILVDWLNEPSATHAVVVVAEVDPKKPTFLKKIFATIFATVVSETLSGIGVTTGQPWLVGVGVVSNFLLSGWASSISSSVDIDEVDRWVIRKGAGRGDTSRDVHKGKKDNAWLRYQYIK